MTAVMLGGSIPPLEIVGLGTSPLGSIPSAMIPRGYGSF